MKVNCNLNQNFNIWIKGLPLSSLKRDELLSRIDEMIRSGSKGNYIIPMNLAKFVYAQKDKKLYDCLKNSTYNIVDGISLKIATKLIWGIALERFPGIELMENLLDLANKKNYSVYLLGGEQEILTQCIKNIKRKLPNIRIVGYNDGYSWKNKVEELIDSISRLASNIIFIALGMPQKEYFIYDYCQRVNANVLVPVGGSFDVIAGAKKRAHPTIQKLGIEWLWRSIYDYTRFVVILRNMWSFLIILLSELWNTRIMKRKEDYGYTRYS